MGVVIAVLLASSPGPHAYKQLPREGGESVYAKRCSQHLVTGFIVQALPDNEYLISAPTWTHSDPWEDGHEEDGPSGGYGPAILRMVSGSFSSPGYFEAICAKDEKFPMRTVTMESGFSKKLHVYEQYVRPASK